MRGTRPTLQKVFPHPTVGAPSASNSPSASARRPFGPARYSWQHKTLIKSHTKTNSAVCHEAWLSTVWSVIISIKVSSISSLSECWKDPWAVYRVLKPDNRLTTFTFPTFLHHFQSFFCFTQIMHDLVHFLHLWKLAISFLFLFLQTKYTHVAFLCFDSRLSSVPSQNVVFWISSF